VQTGRVPAAAAAAAGTLPVCTPTALALQPLDGETAHVPRHRPPGHRQRITTGGVSTRSAGARRHDRPTDTAAVGPPPPPGRTSASGQGGVCWWRVWIMEWVGGSACAAGSSG